MVEEIRHAKPIMRIPEQQIIAGKLRELRKQHSRIRRKEAVTENEMAQKQLIAKLVAMGRQDLTIT
jgi:hypothetical protein